MRNGSRYFTAAQAAATLRVTRATLYAYASRGQLRSEPVPGRPRDRRYHREDVERLQERKAARRDPDAAAARGLRWGGPVLDSGITLIDDGRLYYRGVDALALARTACLEDVASLLWAADEAERGRLFAQPIPLSLRRLKGLRTFATDPIAQLQAALPIAAAADPAAYDLRPPAVRRTGARIVRLLAAVVSQSDAAVPVHRALRLAWAPRRAALDEVIRTALVLCADHELNVSAFAARCAASAGATPYDVVSAALATLKGYRHGGAGERALALIAETEPARATAVISERMRRGDRVPGFGHPLYPGGDPRAVALLRLAEAGANEAERRRVVRLQKAGAELLEEHPNLDFGLAAVARAWGLPDRAPIVLFALGRTVGWIAHAIEEYASGGLIRPRARYVGPRPAARP